MAVDKIDPDFSTFIFKVNSLAIAFDFLDHDILQINSSIKFSIGNHKLDIEYTGQNSGKEFVGFFLTRTGRKTEDGSVEYGLGSVKIVGLFSKLPGQTSCLTNCV